MQNLFSVSKVTFIPTTRCTLHCRMCINRTNGSGLVKARDFPWEDVCRDMDECFRIFDRVGRIDFMGGEIFMHPEFFRILEHTKQYEDQFDELVLVINATIFPDEAGQRALLALKDKLIIKVSDYGPLSYARDKFCSFCEQYGIALETRKYYGNQQYCDGWIDLGEPVDLNEPDDILEATTQNCTGYKMQAICCMNGRLTYCTTAAFLYDAKVLQPGDQEIVDLCDSSVSIEAKRETIAHFFDRARRPCRYCKFRYNYILPRYPAGEQLL